jgi:archaellum component FlaF (FlaF/FlaG flagellin family)
VGIVLAQPNIDQAMDDLKEAREGYSKELLDTRNTDFNVNGAVYNTTNKELRITLTNTGCTVIEGSEVDIMLDGVMTNPTSGLSGHIYPGGSSTLILKSSMKPTSISVCGPYGIAVWVGEGAITGS